jgi:hypothetical protein
MDFDFLHRRATHRTTLPHHQASLHFSCLHRFFLLPETASTTVVSSSERSSRGTRCSPGHQLTATRRLPDLYFFYAPGGGTNLAVISGRAEYMNERRTLVSRRWALLVALTLIYELPGTIAWANYSCGNAQGNHCYGNVQWDHSTEYFGVWSDQWPTRMECGKACSHGDGFITSEAWLVDNSTNTCTRNRYQLCWVEVGLYRNGSEKNPVYFWADGRPSGSFNLHVMGDEKFESPVYHYVIINDGRGKPGTYQINVYDDSLKTFHSGTSKNNNMSPTVITVGQELEGQETDQNPDGAWAEFTLHTENTWATKPMGADWIFWGEPQTTSGTKIVNSDPPLGGWWAAPDSGLNQGGAFATACCQHF